MHQDEGDRIIEAMEETLDRLPLLRDTAARALADAKRTHARALLDARSQGYSSREEREAHATLEAADAQQAADIAERTYRDALTHLRLLQSQLDLARTRIVTERNLRV